MNVSPAQRLGRPTPSGCCASRPRGLPFRCPHLFRLTNCQSAHTTLNTCVQHGSPWWGSGGCPLAWPKPKTSPADNRAKILSSPVLNRMTKSPNDLAVFKDLPPKAGGWALKNAWVSAGPHILLRSLLNTAFQRRACICHGLSLSRQGLGF